MQQSAIAAANKSRCSNEPTFHKLSHPGTDNWLKKNPPQNHNPTSESRTHRSDTNGGTRQFPIMQNINETKPKCHKVTSGFPETSDRSTRTTSSQRFNLGATSTRGQRQLGGNVNLGATTFVPH
jgi:hypothetical protein